MKRTHLLLVLLVALLAAGCQRFRGGVATPIVADTPTPRSTPLPPVATDVPPGAEDNPLALVIVDPGSGRSPRALTTAADQLIELLADETDLTVEVTVVQTQAEAYAMLCESGRGRVGAAWVNGLTYAVAFEAGCGEPALQVERGTGRTASVGEQVRLIVNRTAGIQSVTNLGARPFCRVSVDDFYTWLMPSLMLRVAGLDPLTLENVVDLGDVADVIAGVAEGRACAAAGVSSTDFADFADADQEADIAFIGQPVVVPYAILMLPSEMPLGVRSALVDGLQAIAIDPDRADTLEILLNQTRLIPADASDFTTFLSFVRSTGLNLGQLDGE
ncbi:MAG: PhnD/SsuA/transferrin family substrate-binding protein [Chloroflexota bacterium]|nr:PhnD/SsuA/transferrin family substrate-binding protein [Chloroflexota bacterium]